LDEYKTTKQDTIHAKGFDLFNFNYAEPNNIPEEYVDTYGKIKVGVKQLEDAILELGTLKLPRLSFCNKKDIMDALIRKDHRKLKAISDFFYAASGIYQSVCNYLAYLYRYDWYIYPENVKESANPNNVIEEYTRLLTYLDGTYIKKMCGDIALKVIKYGAFYGYIVDTPKGAQL
jgi:hypothetical protein